MPIEDLDELTRDRPLLPFLPLIYVAWADGEVSPIELREISSQVAAIGGLGDDCLTRLQAWLDPANPPTARQLQAMLKTIRRAASELPPGTRSSLAELGRGIADLQAPDSGVHTPAVDEALAHIESALGIIGSEVSRELLTVRRPVHTPAPVERLFDARAMQELLDSPYGDVRDRVRRLLSQPRFAYQTELDRSAYRELVLEWCRELGAEGFGSLGFSPAYGGGRDTGEFVAVFETIAFHDMSLLVKFGVQFGLFGGSIFQLGTERHHHAYLEQIGSVTLPGCFAMSETGHGSNVQDLGTIARFDPETDEFVIHTPAEQDRKDWIGNAALHGRLATVFAQLEIGEERHGVHAFLVPLRSPDGTPMPGVAIGDCGHKEGLNGVDNGRIAFDMVRIPRDNLLDRFAQVDSDGAYQSAIASPTRRFFTMLGTLVGGRISVAGAALSAAKTALTIAVRYGAERRQFGPAGESEVALLDYRSHQRRLMPPLAACYAIDFAHKNLVRRYIERKEDDAREVEALAAGIKAYSTWQTMATLQECREACGGQGYLTVNRIAVLRDDTDVFTTFEGDNTVLMQLVAKARLTEYRHQFADLRFSGLVKHIAGRAATAVTVLNPLVTRMTDEGHLLDPEFQLGAFRYREERLLTSVARRLKSRLDSGMDSFQALNDCQIHVLRMAEAYIERVVVEQALAAVERQAASELGPILRQVIGLFVLWRLEKSAVWFLANGYFEGVKAKAIRDQVTRLCSDVRRSALPLVESFGIPDEILAAPIAGSAESPEAGRT
ncbi:MAG: acyl-CoA dehydrogenase family protein [Acidobacteriota bacterium]|nr:acyl-CoA dehydrogenase family protein [Acidobacteriota bacterium]